VNRQHSAGGQCQQPFKVEPHDQHHHHYYQQKIKRKKPSENRRGNNWLQVLQSSKRCENGVASKK